MTTGTMEVIIRPFAPVVITPPAIAVRATGLVVPPVAFSFGGSGGRNMSITLDKKRVVVADDKKQDLKESSRQSTKVKVVNPDDPSQFVEFCRADHITMRPKKEASPAPSATHASTDPAIIANQGDVPGVLAHGAANDAPSSFDYKYPSDKTCKSPSEPPKGCS